jgi:1,4-dihydroxy-2-naphthoyl-CoA hydrolase|tara:strand:+ start:456 stop:875 length:420 start_codon:yes stop_codon:yes gene_type:complete
MNKQEIIDRIHSRSTSTMVENLGIEIIDVGKNFISGKMPVDERTKQPFGLLHGGASVALAETLGSIGAGMQIDHSSQSVVGIEINANHLKSVKSGWVFGTATAVRIGRKIQVWEIDIKDKNDNYVCKSRLTLAVIEKND